MPRPSSPVEIALPSIGRGSDALPRQQQVYAAVRDLVLSGRVEEGSRLPSSRRLAAAFGVARNTVLAALERLCAEQLIASRRGSGCRVLAPAGLVRDVRAHRLGRSVAQAGAVERIRPFNATVPALADFPVDLWARLVRRRWRSASPSMLGYSPPGGYQPLREVIAARLSASRAVRCHWSQVIITPGSRQGLSLVAHAALKRGDAVWVEDPGYRPGAAVFEKEGLRPVWVPVDEHGLNVVAGQRRAPRARAAYITPSHQFPLGVTMSLARRVELLEWARRDGRWIIEDDFDAELRHAGSPLASLQGLDPEGRRVISVGTFSQILIPAIRIAYLVVPESLVEPVIDAQRLSDRHASLFDQAALVDFIAEGHLARHQRRMRGLYAHRRRALEAALRELMPKGVDVTVPDAGLRLLVSLPAGSDAVAVARRAAVAGIDVHPLVSPSRRRLPPTLLVGFATLDGSQIRTLVKRLAALVASS